MSKYNVAIAGATGAVGQEMIKTLEKRNFPVKTLTLLASKRSVGKTMTFKGQEIAVQELTHDSFRGCDIALFSAGSERSKEFRQSVIDAGAVMIDNSSAFRMDPTVPLVVPEVNPEAVKGHNGVIANPNCCTIILVVPLKPLYDLSRITRIVVATYQSASGAGAQAMEELRDQSARILAGEPAAPEIFPYQIAFNLFSHNAGIESNGYNGEENKMVLEARKILGDNDIKITPTCIRVPVFRAHAEAITIEQERKVSVEEARAALAKAPGIRIADDREANYFPMPIEVSGEDDIAVGRIRDDIGNDHGLCLFVAGDQLLKGAALNAVQIAELL